VSKKIISRAGVHAYMVVLALYWGSFCLVHCKHEYDMGSSKKIYILKHEYDMGKSKSDTRLRTAARMYIKKMQKVNGGFFYRVIIYTRG
jgi:hypothetical protein